MKYQYKPFSEYEKNNKIIMLDGCITAICTSSDKGENVNIFGEEY